MSDYIKRQDAIFVALQHPISNSLVSEIKQLDGIDIVRCKECMWRDKDNQGEDYCTYVKGLADITDDSFCSWGERNRR